MVSISGVTGFLRLSRYLRNSALAATAALLVVVVAIQIEQHVLRHRAERLLGDILSLELRQATFEDAQIVSVRWNRLGHYEGSCNKRHCDFNVVLGDFFFNRFDFLGGRLRLLDPYMFAGGRPAQVRARVVVHNGIVWDKSFNVDLAVPAYKDAEGSFIDYTLMGDSGSISSFSPSRWGFRGGVLFHANYIVGKPDGCDGPCREVHFYFTPYADPVDVQRLMRFDLSCLTRWLHPCRKEVDIMPAAWGQYLRESAAPSEELKCTPAIAGILGRDAEHIALTTVEKTRLQKSGQDDSFTVATVRLTQRLKRADFWEPGSDREVRIFDERYLLGTAPDQVRKGDHLLLMFARRPPHDSGDPEVWLDLCGAVPLTDNNLALVTAGISQDWRATEGGAR